MTNDKLNFVLTPINCTFMNYGTFIKDSWEVSNELEVNWIEVEIELN